tara:strand:- start:367 stop:783 length:417 start_codon:yes stop_codon:yes gene_type:complete
MRILAGREHSAAQLRHKLSERGAEPAVCDEVIAQLEDMGFLSESRFAEVLVRSRISQGYGPLRIRAELSEARISDALARDALAEADCDFQAQAEAVRTRRFGDPPEGAAQWQKQYRFLAGRGFESDHIRRALKADFED